MAKKKTFEVEKNGYRMFMVEDSESDYKTLDIRKEEECLPNLVLDVPSRMYNILKDNSFEDLEIVIGTHSMGTQSVDNIRLMLQQYENAIETVEYFKAELIKYKERI